MRNIASISNIGTVAGASSGGGFSPMSISTLFAWYDAKDLGSFTLSGSKITQWLDKSGNGRHLAQATDANRPTYSATGWQGTAPAVDFGTNLQDLFFSMTNTDETAYSWDFFFVFDQILADNTDTMYMLDTSGGRIILSPNRTDTGGPFVSLYDNAWQNIGAANGDAQLLEFRLNQAANNTNVFRNGSSIGSGTYAAKIAFSTDITIGSAGGGFEMDGVLSEVLIYSSALSISNRTTVTNYLRSKWGV